MNAEESKKLIALLETIARRLAAIHKHLEYLDVSVEKLARSPRYRPEGRDPK